MIYSAHWHSLLLYDLSCPSIKKTNLKCHFAPILCHRKDQFGGHKWVIGLISSILNMLLSCKSIAWASLCVTIPSFTPFSLISHRFFSSVYRMHVFPTGQVHCTLMALHDLSMLCREWFPSCVSSTMMEPHFHCVIRQLIYLHALWSSHKAYNQANRK